MYVQVMAVVLLQMFVFVMETTLVQLVTFQYALVLVQIIPLFVMTVRTVHVWHQITVHVSMVSIMAFVSNCYATVSISAILMCAVDVVPVCYPMSVNVTKDMVVAHAMKLFVMVIWSLTQAMYVVEEVAALVQIAATAIRDMLAQTVNMLSVLDIKVMTPMFAQEKVIVLHQIPASVMWVILD